MPLSAWITIAMLAIGSLLPLFEVWKDWNEPGSRKKAFRSLKIAVTFVAFIIGSFLVNRTSKESSQTESENKSRTERLQGSIQTQMSNNDTQYARDQAELNEIRGQLNDIKTQVTTADLRKKLADLQSKLDKSMEPRPKASLAFSFYPFAVSKDNENVAVTYITAPVSADGTVHVDVDIANPTSVDAIDGELTLQICDPCKFVKIPDGFRQLTGQRKTEVNISFARILAKSIIPPITLDVTVPPIRRLRARRKKEWGRVEAAGPNQIWQSDMTKIWAGPTVGWAYLVSVIDCGTREIVSWNLSHRCRTEEALEAVEQAVLRRLPEGSRLASVTLTTDNGTQFTSTRFIETLNRLGITHRRTAYHHPEGNSYIERFHRSLKEEEVWTAEYRNVQEARVSIARWIEEYNHDRPHCGVGNRTPREAFLSFAGVLKTEALTV